MKIKELTYSVKIGQPNFSSVSAGMTAEVGEGEDLDKAFDELKRITIGNADFDPSWIRKDDEATKQKKVRSQQMIKDIRESKRL